MSGMPMATKARRGGLRLRPIQTATVQDQVYREIKRQIMAGAFRPGQTLSMQKVADALGTSTMPVREAFRRLAAEHAVEIRPKRAVKIALMSRSRFREIGDVRVAIEGLATEYAARHITGAEVNELERIIDDAEAARAVADVHRYLAKNQEFHFCVYTAARSYLLLPMIESLWLQIGPVLGQYTESGLSIGAECHAQVVRALKRRDGKGARSAIATDIGLGMQYFLDSAEFESL